jgi:hypothetical protein
MTSVTLARAYFEKAPLDDARSVVALLDHFPNAEPETS